MFYKLSWFLLLISSALGGFFMVTNTVFTLVSSTHPTQKDIWFMKTRLIKKNNYNIKIMFNTDKNSIISKTVILLAIKYKVKERKVGETNHTGL